MARDNPILTTNCGYSATFGVLKTKGCNCVANLPQVVK
jgi:hypothetical protein